MSTNIVRIRSAEQIEIARQLVWEFFDFLRMRYPDMLDEIDSYIEAQDVAGELCNFKEFFLPPRGEAFLALLDGEAAGIVMLKPHGAGDGEMNRMYVRETARGRGLGRMLGEAVLDEARRLGHGTVYLDALYRHVEALPLYESLGFERYEDATVYGGSDPRVVNMRCRL